MKPIIPFALLGALLAIGANAATTDPVGYITSNVAGNVAMSDSGAATYIAPSMVETTEYAGAASASPSGGTVITLPAGVPTTFDGTYMLEISSGVSEGWWSTVVSSTDTSITVADAFPDGLAADVSINVRKFTTLGSWLGANVAGFAEVSAPTGPDLIQVLDPVTQGVSSHGFARTTDGAPQDGWYNLGSSTLADDTIIYPGTAVKVIRFSSDPLPVVSTGEVKLTKTQVDVFPADNWIGQTLATGTDFDGQGFKGQLAEWDGVSVTVDDVIETINPNQSATSFAVLVDGLAPFDIANLGSSTDGGPTPFVEGSGLAIKRLPGSSASVVTFPAQVVAP